MVDLNLGPCYCETASYPMSLLCLVLYSSSLLSVLLTDEVCLARVDRVLQLIGGDAELVLRRPVNSDGVVGGGAQLVSYRWRVGSYAWRKQEHDQTKEMLESVIKSFCLNSQKYNTSQQLHRIFTT